MSKLMSKAKIVYKVCGEGLLGALVVIGCIALVFAIAFGIYCLEGWILMLLWNWLAVSLFGAKVLGYWVCVGICVAIHFLKGLLFPSRESAD